jgi:hypothetical protein
MSHSLLGPAVSERFICDANKLLALCLLAVPCKHKRSATGPSDIGEASLEHVRETSVPCTDKCTESETKVAWRILGLNDCSHYPHPSALQGNDREE